MGEQGKGVVSGGDEGRDAESVSSGVIKRNAAWSLDDYEIVCTHYLCTWILDIAGGAQTFRWGAFFHILAAGQTQLPDTI